MIIILGLYIGQQFCGIFAMVIIGDIQIAHVDYNIANKSGLPFWNLIATVIQTSPNYSQFNALTLW